MKIPSWVPVAFGALIAAVLAIVVGIKLVDLMTGGTGGTAFPSVTLPTLAPTASPIPSPVATPSAPPTPQPTPTLKPTPVVTPTRALSILQIVGGDRDGDYPVFQARSFFEDGYLKVRLAFQVEEDTCTLEIVLFVESTSGTYNFPNEVKGTVTCPGLANYSLFGGSINIVRDGDLTGNFNILSGSGSEQVTIIGEFQHLPIEGG